MANITPKAAIDYNDINNINKRTMANVVMPSKKGVNTLEQIKERIEKARSQMGIGGK